MSFLNIFRRARRGPWDDWSPCIPRPLTYDVERASLDEVPFEAAVQALEKFGRPSNPNPLESHRFLFPPLGLEVRLDGKHTVMLFTCLFSAGISVDPSARGFIPCELSLRHRWRDFRITEASGPADIERVVGRFPDEPLKDELGSVYSVSLNSTYLSFNFDSNDRLLLVDIEPD